ncbi:MAG: hypothetical protein HQL87_08420 [Magnetococcales bacterium]|nr:hypothetical protein [Magnetococcales bacterium]
MNMAYAQSSLGISDILNRLAKKARAERLEAALPLINLLRLCFAPENKIPGAPVGVLTVGDWLELLNSWEEILTTIHQRRIYFIRDFFQESMAGLPVNTPSSLAQALQELLTMMDALLADQPNDNPGNAQLQ